MRWAFLVNGTDLWGVINAAHFDKANINSYAANELLLKNGKKGVSVFCDVEEKQIKCSLMKIEGKEDYLNLQGMF